MPTAKGAGREGRGRPDLELGEYMTPASTAPPYGTCRNQTVRWHHSKASRNTKDSCSWHPMQTAASGINKINGRRDGELIFFEPAVLPAINTPSATWSWVKHECKTALSESMSCSLLLYSATHTQREINEYASGHTQHEVLANQSDQPACVLYLHRRQIQRKKPVDIDTLKHNTFVK